MCVMDALATVDLHFVLLEQKKLRNPNCNALSDGSLEWSFQQRHFSKPVFLLSHCSTLSKIQAPNIPSALLKGFVGLCSELN